MVDQWHSSVSAFVQYQLHTKGMKAKRLYVLLNKEADNTFCIHPINMIYTGCLINCLIRHVNGIQYIEGF